MKQTEKNAREKHVYEALNVFNKVKNTHYEILEEIGGGGFAVVYKVLNKDTGKIVVLKAVDTAIIEASCDNDEVVRYTEDEIRALKICRDCKYVIDILDAFIYPIDERKKEWVYLMFLPLLVPVIEYFKNIDHTERHILDMTKDICMALSFCHKNKIIHRDIKPGNMYYSVEKKCFVLADFGISRTHFDPNHAMTAIGSYLAPEVYYGKDLEGRFNSDIFSLGISTLLMLSGSSVHSRNVFENLKALKPDQLKVIIAKAIATDPALRYQTADEFIEAIKSIVWDDCAPKVDLDHKDVEKVADLLFAGKKSEAKALAEKGYNKTGNVKLACLLAFILHVEKKSEEALWVLESLKDKDSVAGGLYGVIGYHYYDKNNRQLYMDYMVRSADSGFAFAQYFVGRWLMDGQAGFDEDLPRGLDYIFAACKKSFTPAYVYLKKALYRKSDEIESAQAMATLIESALEGYEESMFPFDSVIAIVNA